MRYVAKVHVLDVLDQVVISGYVIDTETAGPDGEEPFEFTWQVPGLGLSDSLEWLLDALHRGCDRATPASPREV